MTNLAERIEAGERPISEIIKVLNPHRARAQAVVDLLVSALAHDGCTTSALRLKEQVLPGWRFAVGNRNLTDGMYWAEVENPQLGQGLSKAKTPAAALVAAIVRAVEAKEGEVSLRDKNNARIAAYNKRHGIPTDEGDNQ